MCIADIPNVPPKSTTNSKGEFQFSGVAKGTYFLTAQKAGYAWGGLDRKLNIAGGSVSDGLTIYLVGGGRLSGKVTTRDGAVVRGARVTCYYKVFKQGIAEVFPGPNSTTNAAGQYAVEDVPQGEYYLFVAPEKAPLHLTDSAATASDEFRVAPAPGFYPAGNVLDAAAPIDVKPGTDVSKLDIVLRESPVFRISGKVLPSASERIPLAVELRESTPEIPSGPLLASRAVSAPDYRFSFEDLPSAQYIIAVRPAARANTIWGTADVNLASREVSDLQVVTGEGIEVTGAVRGDPDSLVPVPAKKLSVRVTNLDIPTASPTEAPVLEDGTFVLRGLAPGRAVFEITGLPQSWYVQCVSISAQPCSNSILRLSTGAASVHLDATVASPAASVVGKVLDENGAAVPAATVLLCPANPDDGPMRTARSDGKGSFAFHGLAPGSYSIHAWAEIEARRVEDFALVDRNRSTGETVHVTTGETVQKKVVALPGTRAQ